MAHQTSILDYIPKPKVHDLHDDHIRGKWVKAGVSTLTCLQDLCHHASVRVIKVPPFNVQHDLQCEKCKALTQREHPLAEPQVTQPSLRPSSPIASLPDELLLLIFERLIPTAMTFHVFPYAATTTLHPLSDPFGTVIHAFGEPKTGVWPPKLIGQMTALVLVNRRFADLYNTLLYGRNAWIISVADVGSIETRIKSPADDKSVPPSWSRWYTGRPTASWPLTARSAKYVRDVTFVVTLRRPGIEEQTEPVRRQVAVALKVVCDGHQLQQLRVHMRIEESLLSDFEKQARSCMVPRDIHFSWSARPDGTNDLHVSVDEQDQPSEDCELVQNLWGLFASLRGVKQVRLSGLIDGGKAEQMASSIMHDA